MIKSLASAIICERYSRWSKIYGDGTATQRRAITRPDAASVIVAVNGQAAANWIVANGGKIIFETAPPAGAIITAGFRFDVPVRFTDDRIEVNRFTFEAGEMPSVSLIEIKEAI